MRSSFRILGSMILVFGLGTAGGCGGGMENVAPASGVVTLDGQPVPEAKIMFHPVAGGPRTSYATTNAQGEFSASTFGVDDGALVGKHKVTITKVDTSEFAKIDPNVGYTGEGYEKMMNPKNIAKAAKPKFIIAEKYSSKDTSGIEVDVVKGETNKFTFNLKSEGK